MYEGVLSALNPEDVNQSGPELVLKAGPPASPSGRETVREEEDWTLEVDNCLMRCARNPKVPQRARTHTRARLIGLAFTDLPV